jgi:hypothetical protein
MVVTPFEQVKICSYRSDKAERESTRRSAGAGMDGGEVSGVITNAFISFSLVRESNSEMYEHSPGLSCCLNSGFAL